LLVGLGIVGALGYNAFYRGKSLEEVVTDIDSKLRAFLDDIATKLPALPPVPTFTPPQFQQSIAPPAAAAEQEPYTPTEPAAEPTNTVDPEIEPKKKDPPVKPKGSGQLPNNPTIPAPPSGSGGAIVAFAGDFDNNARTKATMDSIDKNNCSMIIGAGDYAYSGTSDGWYNSVVGGTRFKGRFKGAKGNHDDGAYVSLFGQPSYEFQMQVAPNLSVVFIQGAKGIDEAKLTQLTQQAKAQSKFVAYVFHEPYVTAKNAHHKGSECKAGPVIEKVARAMGVKLIVAGHNHNYEHSTAGGIHYVTTGASGRKFYPTNCDIPGAVKCFDNVNGFLKVSVGNTLVCQFVSNNGQTLDSFTIT
jgi:predicted phosphodiesterase